MSAWKPSVCGRSTISSSSIIRRQLCMPPQQISPSAASRSPWSSAILQASRKVSAIRFWLPLGSSHHASTLQAESIRTTPLGRTPNSRSRRGDAAGLAHLAEKLLALGRRRPWPSRRRSAARPAPRPCRSPGFAARALSARRLDLIVARVDVDVRLEEEQVEAVEAARPRPRPRRSDRAWCPGRWAARRPALCRPRPARRRCGVWGSCWDASRP